MPCQYIRDRQQKGCHKSSGIRFPTWKRGKGGVITPYCIEQEKLEKYSCYWNDGLHPVVRNIPFLFIDYHRRLLYPNPAICYQTRGNSILLHNSFLSSISTWLFFSVPFVAHTIPFHLEGCQAWRQASIKNGEMVIPILWYCLLLLPYYFSVWCNYYPQQHERQPVIQTANTITIANTIKMIDLLFWFFITNFVFS